MKIKRKSFLGVIAALCACTALTFGAVFSARTINAEAKAAGANDKVIQLTLDSTNLAPNADANGKMFSGAGLATLYDEILGTTYANIGTYNKLKSALNDSSTAQTWTSVTPNSRLVTVPNAINASDIRARSGHNIQVKIGKTAFEVVYVTLDNNGDVVATLWQAESTQQSFWAANAAGTAGGFSVNENRNNNATTRPSNVYGNSFVRAKMLGQGGTWDAFSGSGVASSPQSAVAAGNSTSTIYADLWNSMTTGDLSQYIDSPSLLKYQEIQSYSMYAKATANGSVTTGHEAAGKIWWGYSHPCDAYGVPFDEWYCCPTNYQWNPVVNTAYGGNGSNIISGQDQWKDDKIWLPSITETGHAYIVNGSGGNNILSSTSKSGIWGLDNSQRANTNASDPSTITSTSSSTSMSFLRSGCSTNTQVVLALYNSSNLSTVYATTQFAVRPALHLNLTAAQAAADLEEVNTPQNLSVTYDGTEYASLKSVVDKVAAGGTDVSGNTKWFDEINHKLTNSATAGTATDTLYDTDSAIEYKVEYKQVGKTAYTTLTNFKIRDAGEYKITCSFEPNGNYKWRNPSTGALDTDATKTFTITVKQAELKYKWANDSSMSGATWSKDYNATFIDGNSATAKAPWVYLDYTLLSGDSAKDNDTSGGAANVIADDKYPYVVLKFAEKVNTFGDAAIDADNNRTRITGTKGGNYPKESQTYTVTFVDKNAATGNYKLVPDTSTGESASRDYTIKPKQVNKPATVAALTYNGAAQKFTINNYDSALMDYGTSSGSTFTAGNLPAGMTKGTGAKDFEATNAGKYEIEFRLKTNTSGKVRNYAWSDGTQTILKVPYEIKPKTLEFTFTQPGTSWTVKVTDTGAITQTYAGTDGPVTGETPRLQYYYYFQTDGAANKVVIPEGDPLNIEDVKDAGGNRTVGVYVTGVQFVLDSNGDPYPVNENYALGTSAEIANLTLTAGEAGIDGITLAYKDSTMGASDGAKPLPNGASALKYALDGSGNAVSFFPQLDFTGTVFEPVGDPSYACTDGSTPAFASGINKAGKVTVTVNIAIKASEQGTNKMPTAYSGTKFKTYTRTDDYHATVTFEYEIGKMEIDTSVFKLQYSYNQTDWKDFATTDNKVEFANSTIYVRIDPTSLKPAAAGISVMFGTNTYASGKNKNAYTASANFTLTDNDNFTIQSANYAWEITNKQITVTNWVPGDFKIDGVDHTGEIMVINGHKALYDAGVIEYVYTWSAMDGSSGSGAGEAELAKIFALASATNQVTVTATVQLKASAASTYDLSGSALTSAAFYVGAAKTIANVTNSGSVEFGSASESALGVSVEADGANLPATNAVTGALLYEIYLHDYDGLSVDNITGDGYGQLSGVDYSKLNVGKYVIEVRLTAAGSQDYALKGARQIFEIAPKKVTVPQLTGEITFNGGYINIADHLDGNYNADIMSLVSSYTNKNAGDYTVTFKLASSNYEWVEPTSAEPASMKLFGKAVLFVDGIAIDNSALTATLDWKINKIVLGTGGWNLGSKEGVSLAALADYQKMIEDNQLDVTIGYRYYDTNGNLIEEPVLKGGDKYLVEAFLAGADAANFEFEDGTDEAKSISAQQEYTVPQSGAAKFFGSVADFAKANWLWFVIGAAVLLFLIILICIIASAKKKKKKREALEEQRRLEKEEREREEKEREREERRLEREERMARMNQQQAMPQMMMPQMMPQMPMQQPQYAPQSQPMAMGGGSNEAQFMQMQAELAAVKAEQAAMRAEQNAVLRSDMNAMRNDYMMDKSGGTARISSDMSAEKLAEIITAAVKSALADETKPAPTANATPENSAASAAPVATQVPPDAVMTTVTTTKIDTTKKAQGTHDTAQAARPTRSFVPPMPVDDGRVFDVGGFYKPADPATDFNFDEEDKKD